MPALFKLIPFLGLLTIGAAAPAPTVKANDTIAARQSASLGSSTVVNECNYPVYLWSVDQINGPGAPITIGPGQTYTEPLRRPCDNCGVSLKISKTTVAHPIIQFEYGVTDLVYYEISLIDCVNGEDASACPGHEGGLKAFASVEGNQGGCAGFQCGPGQYCPDQAYYVPESASQPVHACGVGARLELELCSPPDS